MLLIGCRQLVGIEERQAYEQGAPEPVVTACGLPNRGAACASCMAANCCAVAQPCAGDAKCLTTERCEEACALGDSSCRLGCSNQWEPVNMLQAKLQDCRNASCANACGSWDCLGNVTWQVPNPIPDTITVGAIAQCESCSPTAGSAGIPGVQVQVCSIADPMCETKPAMSSAATDTDGNVSLTFSTQGNPTSVFLEFHKEGWLDSLVILNTPPLAYNFNVGGVILDQQVNVDQIATGAHTIYDPNLAIVKLRVNDCNFQPSNKLDLVAEGVTIAPSPVMTDWDVALNLPIPDNHTTRLVARLKDPTTAAPQDPTTEPRIASVNLVVRGRAITIAPFVTPTP